MSNVDKYYKILDLEPGASPEEVKQGYKDLVLVWHPDRFPNHPRLQKKAQAKLQEINEAREKLQAEMLKYQTVAPIPQTSSEPFSPHSQSKVNDFYREKVKQTWRREYKKAEDYIHFACHRQYDPCVWLD